MPRRSLELLAVNLSILGCEELTRGLMLQHVTPREIPVVEELHRRDTDTPLAQTRTRFILRTKVDIYTFRG